MNDKKLIVARVHTIVLEGKHGPYAAACSIEQGFQGEYITFSLESPVWNESSWPEPGHDVVLDNLTHKKSGWRAGFARFLRPANNLSDNQGGDLNGNR